MPPKRASGTADGRENPKDNPAGDESFLGYLRMPVNRIIELRVSPLKNTSSGVTTLQLAVQTSDLPLSREQSRDLADPVL